ncbi:Kinesin heavy chain-like protein [Dorcoceras hygrometricum]|uniref:Kinesin heavy chain-like protein n=1 Tax=Dorcoceras hygrometricum TaxID=472368 RepID=A0A2Z7CAY1_9LAMI|nr:Kinesin heavy chain-like protein [Dorcoceras hygrometricum]
MSSSRKNQQVACIPDARGSDVVEDPVASYSAISRCYLKIAKRSDEATMDPVATQRIPVAMSLSIQSQEDSGEAFGQPVASNSSIQSRYSRKRRSIDGAGTKKFSRSYSVQQLKIQQMRRGAKFGLSCDDISLDVITISRWISADDEDQQMKRSARS